MFTIEKANLANNSSNYEQQSLKEAKLDSKSVGPSSKKKGLNFYDADGSFFCYAKYSKNVATALLNKTMTVDQLLSQGFISKSVFDKEDGNGEQTYYTLVLPNELRGGQILGKVSDIIKNSKKLVRKTVTIADISQMIEV